MSDLTYFRPIKSAEIGATLSCDNLRYSVKIDPRCYDDLIKWCDLMGTRGFVESVSSYTSHKVGGYRNMWTWFAGDSSVTFGLGHNQGGVKQSVAMLDFNPNKMGETRLLREVMGGLLGSFGPRLTLSRWDLACDLWEPRNALNLLKDKRGYELHVKQSVTQYLGQRNKPGRVKLYDKGAELGLPELGISRLEITCDGEWTAWNICGLWPKVVRLPATFPDGRNMSDTTRVLVTMLVDMMNDQKDIEIYLRDLPRMTAHRIRKSLDECHTVPYPGPDVEKLCELVKQMPELLSEPL